MAMEIRQVTRLTGILGVSFIGENRDRGHGEDRLSGRVRGTQLGVF